MMQLYQQIPHHVQQIMSGESMPILSGTIPLFELFMTAWEKLIQDFPNLKQYVDPGLEWAYTYYARMDRTAAYMITICKLLCLPTSDNKADHCL